MYEKEDWYMFASHSTEQVARQIWLLYYNRVLLERGLITTKEHNQMKIKIQSSINRH